MNIIAAADPLADLPNAGLTPGAWLALVVTILAILAIFSCLIVWFDTGPEPMSTFAALFFPAFALFSIAIIDVDIERVRAKEVAGVITDVNDKAIGPKGVVGTAYTIEGYDFPVTIREKELGEGTWVRLACTSRDGVVRCYVKDSRYPAENP